MNRGFASFFIFIVLEHSCGGNEIVQTRQGQIQGRIEVFGNDVVHQFLKVPFAKPPIGELRFTKPQPPVLWNGVRDASQYGPACMQGLSNSYKKILVNKNESEDCLYLNIYVPNEVKANAGKAVMLYVHGGGFAGKTAGLLDGSYISQQGDVIFVIINYRLGMFGFLSTEDNVAKGNYGLWDQIAALKWVQQNIQEFGGDPKRVTLIGHSAGGYSIGLLLLSHQAYGLFQRAIPMSGFGLSKRAITHNALKTSMEVGIKLGCCDSNTTTQNVNTSKLHSCMMTKTAADIVTALKAFRKSYLGTPQFIMRPAPVIDGDLLKDFPEKLIADASSAGFRTFASVDYMAGTNSDDGGLIRSYLSKIEKEYSFDLDDGVPLDAVCGSITPALSRDYYGGNINVSDAMCLKYKHNDTLINQGRSTVEMYGDMMYDSPAVSTLKTHSRSSRASYHFVLTRKASFATTTSRLPSWFLGAYHGDEVVFIFGMPRYNFSSEEKALSSAMMTYLTNFAKYGNPNVDPEKEAIPNWPKFKMDTQAYIDFDLNITAHEFLNRDRMDFWLKTIPDIVGVDQQTVDVSTAALQTAYPTIVLLLLAFLECFDLSLRIYV